MSIQEFIPLTFPIDIPRAGRISSEELSAFSSSIANDMASLSDILNKNVLKVLSALPEGFDADKNKIDGMSLFVDANADYKKDNGIFYYKDTTNVGQSRPLTIYETLLMFLQILANIENGLKEGVRVGDYLNQVSVGPSQSLQISWPYSDKMFDIQLFEESNSTVTKASGLDISVNSDTNTLIINSSVSKNIWGFIWHPVFQF